MSHLRYYVMFLLTFASIYEALTQNQFIRQNYRDSENAWVLQDINTTTGDTTKLYTRTGKYKIVSNTGIVLVSGHLVHYTTSQCLGSQVKHGHWIERFRNGNLKLVGNYNCGNPIGSWTFYHENGNVKKLKSYNMVYAQIMSMGLTDKKIFTRPDLTDGLYAEYYENGQTKTMGHYELIEVYADHDTVWTVNPITYEEIPDHLVSGDFWFPLSRKSGLWIYYDEDGAIIKLEDYSDMNQEIISRPLSVRFTEANRNWSNSEEITDD